MSHLKDKHCKPCEGGYPPLTEAQINEMLEDIDGWQYKKGYIYKTYKFKNYYQNIAFVNMIAWLSHQENHHPVLKVTYNTCQVRYSTDAIDGMSENDFICAAKVDEFSSHKKTDAG